MLSSINIDIPFVLSTIFITLVAGFILSLINFYLNLQYFPRGPLPLPLIGNVLEFTKRKHVNDILNSIGQTYGGLTTIWFSSIPVIIITEPKLVVNILKDRKNDFAGRPYYPHERMSFHCPDIVLGDFGDKRWDVMRRTGYSAVRKYAISDSLPYKIIDVVDDFAEDFKNARGKPIEAVTSIHTLTFRILARIAFGKEFRKDDQLLHQLIDMVDVFMNNNGFLMLTNYIPVIEYTIFYKTYALFERMKQFQRKVFYNFLDEHEKEWKKRQHDDDELGDFTDAIIAAKEEAIAQGQLNVAEIMDRNVMCSVMYDLFVAGGDTTKDTLLWLLLLISNQPEIQKKMRQEVEQIADDEVPTLGHKGKFNYLQAVISETMRFRPIVPFGMPHKTTCDVELNGFTIKKGTMVMASIHNVMNDEKYFDEPNIFKPERFLDQSGNYISNLPSFYPFSIGRRKCIGEKLATSNLFVIVIRMLQQTKGYMFEPEYGPGTADLQPDISNSAFVIPNSYKLKLVKV